MAVFTVMFAFVLAAAAAEAPAQTGEGACSHVCNGGPLSFPEVRDWNSLTISLSRGICYGTCPVYHVEIHGDGRVVFNGRQYVAQPGHHEARIPVAKVRALFARFRAADFFSLRDSYRGDVTDNPLYTVTLAFDGREKSVGDYVGGMVGMPAVVSELEHAVDEAAETERWIKAGAPAP